MPPVQKISSKNKGEWPLKEALNFVIFSSAY